MGKVKERNSYWDIVKGLAIIAVVYGHSGAKNINLVYLYHLPLFFFVSGFLYKDKYSNDPYAYTTQKIRGIVFPAIKYYVIFTLMHNFLLKVNIYSSIAGDPMITQVFPYDKVNMIGAIFNSIFMTSWETIGGPIWFVKPLFVVMVMFAFVRYFSYKVSNKNSYAREIITLILVATIGIVGIKFVQNNIVLPWRAETGLLVIPIIYIGFILGKKYKVEWLKWYWCLMSVAIMFYLMKRDVGIDLSANRINKPLYFYLGCFSGIYINLYLAKLITKSKKVTLAMSYIGRKSFDIMALHILYFKIVDIIYVKINNLSELTVARYPISNTNLWLLYSVVGLVGPLLTVWLIDKVKLILITKRDKDIEFQGELE